MKSAYPKLVGGIFIVTLVGLATGAAIAIFLFLASLPMVEIFHDPSTASQVAIVVAAFVGILTAAIAIAFGSASWKRQLDAELYRARIQNLYGAWPPPLRQMQRPTPRYGPSRR